MRLIFVLLLALFTPAQAQGCSKTNPCDVGCCSKFGFCGLGPAYCDDQGTDPVCVANCDRKADCDPGGYGASFVNHTTCPLNVCCSKWGFCGMTEEFCGDKTVPQPSCSAEDHKFTRVVGYYEGWAMRRPCNRILPYQIPRGVYTHLNFAFATIDPITFQVVPDSYYDKDTYSQLTLKKKNDPGLKVFIAIGGWTFNDPGQSTATTFSDIARSEDNQRAFISSLISFLATYDFDGIDLDWEYPVAPDRNGRGEDFENFPKFIANLKRALRSTGGRDGLSITLPASYWYLQHFDIKNLEPNVDFFNIMSYDLHGTWDISNKWVGPYLNAHTNLTEIDDALDLLWRNDIPPNKVTMGLAFYGRGFTADSPSCLTPGCTYGSGSNARMCSREVGVLLNSEIVDIIAETHATPTLYSDAAVKVLAYDDNQWVAYDDEETLALKIYFAKSKCLGGVMVWAVSHDTQDARFSTALGSLAKKEFAPFIRKPAGGSGYSDFDLVTDHPQCKWTNCGESCPNGYTTISRSDGGAQSGEIMLDDQGCEGFGSHVLCCPVGNGVPKCGWFDHGNGNCSPNCPTDWIEIGGNSNYCEVRGSFRSYQAACCQKVIGIGSHRLDPPDNMKLYSQCAWGTWPGCNGQCTVAGQSTLVADSWSGNGGAHCFGNGRRPYCCGQSDPDWAWQDCEWYRDQGKGLSGSNNCKSGCPANKVRVAMDDDRRECRGGTRAKCCSPMAQTIERRSNPMVETYRLALQQFVSTPICPADMSPLPKRSMRRDESYFGFTGNSSVPERGLTSRATTTTEVVYAVEEYMQITFFESGTTDDSINQLWEEVVTALPQYADLTFRAVRNWVVFNPMELEFFIGTMEMPFFMLCILGLESLDAMIAGSAGGCVGVSVSYCARVDGIQKRDPINWVATIPAGSPNAGSYSGTVIPATAWLYTEIFMFPDQGCINFDIRVVNQWPLRLVANLPHTATEHHIERQTVPMWISAAIENRLAADGPNVGAANGPPLPNPAGAIPPNFFTDTLTAPGAVEFMTNPPGPAAGDAPLWTSIDRLMNALGSRPNWGVFSIVDEDLNCLKTILWGDSYSNPVAPSRLTDLVNSHDYVDTQLVLVELRNVIAVFHLLNHAVIHGNMERILLEFRRELRIAERLHAQRHGGVAVRAVDNFDNWMQSHFLRMELRMRNFVTLWTGQVAAVWANDATPSGRNILGWTAALANEAARTSINQQNFWRAV